MDADALSEARGPMKLLWHYTAEHRIGDILRCGYVDVARLHILPPERAIAWFSTDQYWERTVRKAEPYGSMEEMLRAEVKLYRIGVLPEAAPLNWTAIRKQSGMSAQIANRLAAAARKWGANPLDWYGSFSPVLESQWQAIEVFKNGWEKLTITEIQRRSTRQLADEFGSKYDLVYQHDDTDVR